MAIELDCIGTQNIDTLHTKHNISIYDKYAESVHVTITQQGDFCVVVLNKESVVALIEDLQSFVDKTYKTSD